MKLEEATNLRGKNISTYSIKLSANGLGLQKTNFLYPEVWIARPAVSMAQQITQEKQTAISTVHPNKLYDEQEEILDVIKAGKANWKSVTITNPNIFEKLTKIYSSP